ncbi:hypothetical protein ACIBF6_41715 [Streptosporangium amethystogenes]
MRERGTTFAVSSVLARLLAMTAFSAAGILSIPVAVAGIVPLLAEAAAKG